MNESIHGAPHQPLSLPAIHRATYHAIHPGGTLREKIQSMEVMHKQFLENQAQLKSMLDDRKQLIGQTKERNIELNALDKKIHQHYQSMLKQRNKLGGILRKISTGLSIVGSVVGLVKPEIGMAINAVASGVGALGSGYQKGTSKAEYSYQKVAEGVNGTREGQANFIETLNYEVNQIEANQAHNIKTLLVSGDYYAPDKYRGLLVEADKQLQQAISDKTNDIEQGKKDIKSVENVLSRNEAKEKKLKDELSKIDKKKDKKKYKKLKKKLLKTQAKLAGNRHELTIKQRNLESQEKALGDLNKDNEKLDKVSKQETTLAPVKDYFHQAVVAEVNKWKAQDENIQQWRDAIEKGLQEFNQARQIERQLVNTSFNLLDNLFSEMAASPLTSYLDTKTGVNFSWGIRKTKQTSNLVQQVYALTDVYQTWKKGLDAFNKTLESLPDNLETNRWLGAIEKMGPVLFATSCVFPNDMDSSSF